MATRSKGAAKERTARASNGEMTERQREQLAKRIARARQTDPPTPWSEIKEVEGIATATYGRRLLTEYGYDDLIREQLRDDSPPARKRAPKATKSAGRGRKAQADVDDEYDDDVDEAPAPRRRGRAASKKVTVKTPAKRGRGRAVNPS